MKYASVFAGVGGFDLGFDAAGMQPTAQVEINKHSRAILARHWPNVERTDDVISTTGKDLGKPDLVVGGFPCQDTSHAAPHRTGLDGKRGRLYYEFVRLVDEVARLVDESKPRWVCIENPVGLLKSNKGRDMEAVVRGLEDLGYGWAYRVVDGRHLGSAQRRRRVLVVGHRGGDGRPAWDVLADDDVGSESPSVLDESRRDSRSKVGSVVTDDGRGLIYRKSRRPRSKDDYSTWVLDGDANTLTGFDSGNSRQTHIVVQGGRARTLTLTEWERLTCLPDGWTEGVPDSHRFKALGDAMHAGMAEWLGRRFMQTHESVPFIG